MNTYESLAIALYRAPTAKTAAYNVQPSDIARILTNRGATGAVTFTLPAVANVPAGWFCEFFVVADQSVTITAPSGKLVTFNNAAATSIAFSTSAEKVGAGAKITFDGTSYLAELHTEESQTVTVS